MSRTAHELSIDTKFFSMLLYWKVVAALYRKNLTCKTLNRLSGVVLVEKDPILVIDKAEFVVTLHKDWIDVDLKEGGKARLVPLVSCDALQFVVK